MNILENNSIIENFNRYQSVTVGNKIIVLSALDQLSVGDITSLLGKEAFGLEVYLFASKLSLRGEYKFLGGGISADVLFTDAISEVIMTNTSDSEKITLPTFNISGSAGETKLVNGEAGGNGENAGNLSLFVLNQSGVSLEINAQGGKGGDGADSNFGKKPGSGGNGGVGGKINFVLGSIIIEIYNDIRKVFLTLEKSEISSKKLRSDLNLIISEKIPKETIWNPIVHSLQKAINTKSSKDLRGDLLIAGQLLENFIQDQLQSIDANINVDGGLYGLRGEGEPPAKNGISGAEGINETLLIETSADLISSKVEPFFLIHPSQCKKALDAIKLQYFSLNGQVDISKTVTDLTTNLKRVIDKTELFVQADNKNPWIEYFSKHELEFGSKNSVSILKDINMKAKIYLGNLFNGYNFFGQTSSQVPLASFFQYKETLNTLIADFRQLELDYDQYLNTLNTAEKKRESIINSRSFYSGLINFSSDQSSKFPRQLRKIASNITQLNEALKPSKKRLLASIAAARKEIDSKLDFNIDSIFQAVSTIAFAPKSRLLLASEIANVGYNAFDKVTSDTGLPIKKSYVVNQIRSIEGSLESLIEGYKQLENGTLEADDPGAGKLLVARDKFLETMDSFKNRLGDKLKDVSSNFDKYISDVITRNNAILEYNNVISNALSLKTNLNEANQQLQEITRDYLETSDPDLPAIVDYVSYFYERSRDQILQHLYLASQSYKFWALSDESLLENATKNKSLVQINATILNGIKEDIITKILAVSEDFGTERSDFPAEPDEPGVVVTLGENEIFDLQATNSLIFTLKPALYHSTTIEESGFAGMADVRINEVRIYVKGANTKNGMLNILITHQGHETIVSTDNETHEFSHKTIKKNFQYDMKHNNKIHRRANFGYKNPRQFNTNASNGVFAPVGPFTSWLIEIPAELNEGLDLMEVSEIEMQFFGTYYNFD
ncbi:hypothetical protein HG263_07335 [Pseudoalteromonas sp. JBTF-M23]|uniref:Uncharacterized protein n=1 Tax=Pseudoalteromonas caenipelagi TaxID=2726988 RepID=A0A849VEI9_9GAMM|nr:hypothetical protein [Pseudoalteromonas caenipelagi]NOU50354.1 hypothetical protein [Pseudoalteromonas caenipelagi]